LWENKHSNLIKVNYSDFSELITKQPIAVNTVTLQANEPKINLMNALINNHKLLQLQQNLINDSTELSFNDVKILIQLIQASKQKQG
jgi:hypothetical protein